MSFSSIQTSLKKCSIKKGDTLMIHGDAAIALMNGTDVNKELKKLFDNIISFLGKKGTLVVPAFSYSFTQGKNFSAERSPSEIGIFSEYFRKRKGVKRSNHPIFSVCSIGKNSKIFENSDTKTCFGKNTAFDILHRLSGKIVCLGCSFNRITFAHFVEEKLKVNYRFNKKFSGFITTAGKKKFIKTNFFVRDLKFKTDLSKLKKKLIKKSLLKKADYGRFEIYTVNSKDLFNIASKMVENNPYILAKKINE